MKIAVLLSGGVDSSVAMSLLRQAGHDVTAFYLKIWLEDELSYLGTCPWEEDLAFARAVCAQQDVPLEVVSLQRAYWDEVVADTLAQIRCGLTPNPDMLCNSRVKFGAALNMLGGSYDKIATGHYAQVRQKEKAGLYELHCSPDPIKDQTYFLSQLTQAQLSKALFPIGHLTKAEVRMLAQQLDLPNKARKDSQGICFLGKLKFSEFVKHHMGEQPGPMIEYETGKVVGNHQGLWFHTIGQRQGLGLSGGPWYVVAKNMQDNKLLISRSYYSPEKARTRFQIAQGNWIAGVAPKQGSLSVKLRHGEGRYDALINTDATGMVHVQLSRNDQGIAPGQYAVVYDKEHCLGGGVMYPTL